MAQTQTHDRIVRFHPHHDYTPVMWVQIPDYAVRPLRLCESLHCEEIRGEGDDRMIRISRMDGWALSKSDLRAVCAHVAAIGEFDFLVDQEGRRWSDLHRLPLNHWSEYPCDSSVQCEYTVEQIGDVWRIRMDEFYAEAGRVELHHDYPIPTECVKWWSGSEWHGEKACLYSSEEEAVEVLMGLVS